MYTFYVEKTLKNDGTESVVLVNEKYEIIEPVALFLDYLAKKVDHLIQLKIIAEI